jgi:hypothetical protein
VNAEYGTFRLLAHYLYIFIAEFGSVVLYTLLFIILSMRLKSSTYFATPDAAKQARIAAKIMLLYPFIYVVCTLPLASLRMASETIHPPISWFCAAGAMITSNGWLDVLVYTLTRRIDIERPHQRRARSRRRNASASSSAANSGANSPALQPSSELLDSFGWGWHRDEKSPFGNTTTIAGGGAARSTSPDAELYPRKTSITTKCRELFGNGGADRIDRADDGASPAGFGRLRWAGSAEELVQLPKATAHFGSAAASSRPPSRGSSRKGSLAGPGRRSHEQPHHQQGIGEVRAHQTVTITTEPMTETEMRYADMLSSNRRGAGRQGSLGHLGGGGGSMGPGGAGSDFDAWDDFDLDSIDLTKETRSS